MNKLAVHLQYARQINDKGMYISPVVLGDGEVFMDLPSYQFSRYSEPSSYMVGDKVVVYSATKQTQTENVGEGCSRDLYCIIAVCYKGAVDKAMADFVETRKKLLEVVSAEYEGNRFFQIRSESDLEREVGCVVSGDVVGGAAASLLSSMVNRVKSLFNKK